MQQPTNRTAPRQTLDELIEEATGARQMLPPYDRCRELDMLLRAAIEGLLPTVREEAQRTVERTRRWYQLRHLIEDVEEALAADLGSGLLSAAIQLGRLAEQCGRLRAEVR